MHSTRYRYPGRARRAGLRTIPAGASAAALALLLGACGGGEPEVETSTVEMEPEAATADAAPEADVAVAEPVEGAEAALEETASAVDGAADAVAAEAGDGWSSLQANWAESADEVRAHFSELSEEDVLSTGGDREALVAVVGERYSLEPEEAERQVADWEATL